MFISGHVHIHQFRPDGAVLDAAAPNQFQRQWATYEKPVSENPLSHREVTGMLHVALADKLASPINFFDIVCDDARIGIPVYDSSEGARYAWRG